ncbi:MAG: DUF1573 domain-containing protein [Kiritimatiellales bacterium]|nr:DUF1573 domain-containing protein [Kiritimatiellales bacterium]
MNRIYTVCLVGMLLLTEASAELVCDRASFNFGERTEGDVVTHAFILRNTGKKTVVIDRVETDCGCSVGEPSTNSVAPGASAIITASLDLMGRTGKQFRDFYVFTEDSPRDPVALTLEGDSAIRTEITPRMLMFRNVPAGEEHSGTVVLRGLKGDLGLGMPRSSSKRVQCSLTPGAKKDEYILTVVLPEDLPAGTHTASIIIPAYNNTRMLVVPVYASVKASAD